MCYPGTSPTLVQVALKVQRIRDLTQKKYSVLCNYRLLAHILFLHEEIRPEMRQYFFESEKDGMPFSRDTRAVIYQRAKMVLDKRPFGTQEDVYREGYEWMHHSVAPKPHADEKFRVSIGGPDCNRPYSASVFNISAMSFGALSPNAVRALNAGAKKGGFAHDTGEGGVSPYHRENGGDLIWENGSGYFGCRHRDGSFDPEEFARIARTRPHKSAEPQAKPGAQTGQRRAVPRRGRFSGEARASDTSTPRRCTILGRWRARGWRRGRRRRRSSSRGGSARRRGSDLPWSRATTCAAGTDRSCR